MVVGTVINGVLDSIIVVVLATDIFLRQHRGQVLAGRWCRDKHRRHSQRYHHHGHHRMHHHTVLVQIQLQRV